MINETDDVIVGQLDDSKDFKMLGQGNTAEIYQYEDNRILKLFRENMPITPIQNEFRIARIIQNKLDNIPKVYDLLKYRNRYGIVYEQIKGTDMIQLMMKNIFTTKFYSHLIASTHVTMHEKNVNVHYSVKEKLTIDIDSCQDLKPEEKDKIKQYLQTLPDGNQICHFDYHPGNIMICNDRPIVIDWMTACTGESNADVARTLLLMEMGEMMHINPFKNVIIQRFKRIIGIEYLKEYRNMTGIASEDVNKWMLPVAAARLAEWLTDHERAKLVKLVRRELAHLEETSI